MTKTFTKGPAKVLGGRVLDLALGALPHLDPRFPSESGNGPADVALSEPATVRVLAERVEHVTGPLRFRCRQQELGKFRRDWQQLVPITIFELPREGKSVPQKLICYSNGSKVCRTIHPPPHPPHFLSGVYIFRLNGTPAYGTEG